MEGGRKERQGEVQLSTFLYFLLKLNVLPQGHPDLEDGGRVKPQDRHHWPSWKVHRSAGNRQQTFPSATQNPRYVMI